MSTDALTLSPTQQQDYERDGYLLVERTFTGVECDALGEEADRLATWHQVIRPDNLRTEMWRLEGRAGANKYDPVVDFGTAAERAVARQFLCRSGVSSDRGLLPGDPRR